MKKSILITGMSGVGKTTLSNKLNELGYKSYDMDDEPGLFTMISKKTKKKVANHDNADLEKVIDIDWLCDKQKLISIINDESNPLTFYCGNASNIDDILPLFNAVLLLRIDPLIMRERLTFRSGNDFGKTAEVQDWLISWKDEWENSMIEKGVIIVDVRGNLDSVAEEVIELAKSA